MAVFREKGSVSVIRTASRVAALAFALGSTIGSARAQPGPASDTTPPPSEVPAPDDAIAPPGPSEGAPAPAAAPALPAPVAPPSAPAQAAPMQAAATQAAPRAWQPRPLPPPSATPPAPTRGLADDRLSVGYGVRTTWRRDHAYDLFTARDYFLAPDIQAGVELVRLPRAVALALLLDWHREQAHAKRLLGGSFTSHYEAHLATLGLEARHYLKPWLYPHLSLWGGVAATTMRLRNGTPGEARTYREPLQWAAIGAIGLGCSIRTPSLALSSHRLAPRPSLGLRVEGGYTFGQSDRFELRGKAAGSSAIDVHDRALGTLSRSGPYLLATAFVRL